jgi:hypothetical protein
MNSVKSIIFLKEFLSGQLSLPFNYSLMLSDGSISFQCQFPGETTNQMVVIKDVPEYLELEFDELGKELSTSKIKTLEGYYVGLRAFENFDDYLKKKVSPKRRTNLRKYQRRLNHSLNVKYTNYYGAVDREEYDRLFKMLRVFLIRRFDEKQEVNYELPHLEEMEEMVYDLVLDKKANIYVIYHGNKPISIRINMFYKELAYYIISGYDIDYSAFHIGSIDMLKNIEWCFEKNFERYDLLKGYEAHKKNWITHRYFYFDHLIYRHGNIVQKTRKILVATSKQLRYSLLSLSRKFGIYNSLKSMKRNIFRASASASTSSYNWVEATYDIAGKHSVDFNSDQNKSSLLRPVNDFAYRYEERIEDIVVFSLDDQPGQYLVRSKNTTAILLIHSG